MNVILVGACGKMGRNIAELSESYGVEIVCGVDLCPAPMPFPVYRSLDEAKESAQAVIDFSSAQGVEERLSWCKAHSLPVLLAATGYSEADEETIRAYAKELAIFKTGNLSLGVNLLQMLVKKAARILGDSFDAEIIERHHNTKKDAPSGTALMLGRSVNEGFGEHKRFVCGREGLVGARDKSEIGIHAVRGGTIVGEHEVMFAGEDEIITLSHSARSRKVFAAGALRAVKWLIGKSAGLYSMDDLLNETL